MAKFTIEHWNKTRDKGCTCDWCDGRHSCSMGTWFAPKNPKHVHGQQIPSNELCCENNVYSPTVGLSAWIPGPAGITFGLNRDPIADAPDLATYMEKTKPVVAKTGHTCTRCGEYNDYASANQPNGTYVCSYHS